MCLDKLPGVAESPCRPGCTRDARSAGGQVMLVSCSATTTGSAAPLAGRAVISAGKLQLRLPWAGWPGCSLHRLPHGYRNRVGAIVGWWFLHHLRRERTFTVDDMPVPSGAYGVQPSQPPAMPPVTHADECGSDTSIHSTHCRLRAVVNCESCLVAPEGSSGCACRAPTPERVRGAARPGRRYLPVRPTSTGPTAAPVCPGDDGAGNHRTGRDG
jgi:hypothetical protein